jgi:hypothetical protein
LFEENKSQMSTRHHDRKQSPYYKDWRALLRDPQSSWTAPPRQPPRQQYAPLEWYDPRREIAAAAKKADQLQALRDLLELAKHGPK